MDNIGMPHLTYLVYVGIGFLTLINAGYLVRHWRDAVNEKANEPRTFFGPLLATVLFGGAIGSIGLGYSPNMEETNSKLEGVTESATIQALETEARNRDVVITRTRDELEALRKETAFLKAVRDRLAFDKDISNGEDTMFETRKRLLNRSKDSK